MNFSQSTIFNVIASIGLLSINIIIGIIEARILGPEELGRYNVFLTTQTMFVTLFALGIGQACIYFINVLNKNIVEVVSSSIKFIFPFSILASALLFFTLVCFQDYFGESNYIYLFLFCIGTNALLLNTIFIPVLLAKMQVVKNQVVKYVSRLVALIIIIIIIIADLQLNVGSLISITGLTNIISLLLLYHYLNKSINLKLPINKKLISGILKWGIKLSGNNIASIILSSLPVYFLSWFSLQKEGFENVGYYSRASSLLVVGTIITTSIGPLLYARWTNYNGKELKMQVRKISLPLLTFNLLISLGLVFFAPFVIKLLYGESFLSAVSILQILSFTLICNGMKEICYGILLSQGYPLKIMKNLGLSIPILAILLWLLIPECGIQGCAFVTLSVTILSTFLLMLDVCSITELQMKDFFYMIDRNDISNIVHNLKGGNK